MGDGFRPRQPFAAQDAGLQVGCGCRRVEPQLAGEAAAEGSQRLERRRLIAGSSQAARQQQAGRLPQRRAGGGVLGQRHRPGRVAGRERRERPALQHLQVGPLQLAAVGRCPVLVGVLGQRLAGPQVEGGEMPVQRRGRATGGEVPAGGRRPSQERLGVHLAARPGRERVPGRAGDDQRGRTERPPSTVDQHVQVRGRVGGRVGRPQRLGQRVAGDERAASGQQDADQAADQPPTKHAGGDLLAAAPYREASEEADLDLAPAHADIFTDR